MIANVINFAKSKMNFYCGLHAALIVESAQAHTVTTDWVVEAFCVKKFVTKVLISGKPNI